MKLPPPARAPGGTAAALPLAETWSCNPVRQRLEGHPSPHFFYDLWFVCSLPVHRAHPYAEGRRMEEWTKKASSSVGGYKAELSASVDA